MCVRVFWVVVALFCCVSFFVGEGAIVTCLGDVLVKNTLLNALLFSGFAVSVCVCVCAHKENTILRKKEKMCTNKTNGIWFWMSLNGEPATEFQQKLRA